MRKIASNDDLMTTRQAGELLGVAVRTVQLWVESGVLPAWRTAGGHRRIARVAVEQLLEQRARVLKPKAMAADPGPPVSAASAAPFKLLFVEDDPDLLNLFSAIVQGWTFPIELCTAKNGFEGLVRIGQLQPDLVVTDLNMPGMDGFQMIRALKNEDSGFQQLAIIVATSYGPDEIRDRGGLPPDVRVFQKPLPYTALEELARSHWRKQSSLPA